MAVNFVADVPAHGRLPQHRFHATRRIHKDVPPFADLTEDQLRAYVSNLWTRAWRAKEPEMQRLKTMELLYAGFHYKNPIDNRRNEVTNLCFSTVETVWPSMVEIMPRPEIVPRRGMSYERSQKLQEFSTWLMDTNEFDVNHWLATRNKLKYGWCVHLITFHKQTGMPYPKQWSVFDFYPDPDAHSEETLEYFFLAAPIQTSKLRAMFPGKADKLHPDGITSPGYDVYVRPYFDALASEGPQAIGPALDFSRELWSDSSGAIHSDPTPTTSTVLVNAPGGSIDQLSETTFLLQLFVRDRGKMAVTYEGEREIPDAADETGRIMLPGQYQDFEEDCCESGWRVIQMTASGVFPDEDLSSPLDTCYGGVPIVIGRDYWNTGRLYGIGEIENLAPINRAINRRKNLLNRALEYESLPILLVDRDIGAEFDADRVEPGDVIKASRGSRAEWLIYNGPSGDQFQLLGLEREDADNVTGVHDVQEGRKPAGIEAAAAIRSLQAAAQQRIRGKERPQAYELSVLLGKLLLCASKKLQRTIYFRATSGADLSLSPEDLEGSYDVRFAPGTGMAKAREEQEEKILQLFQLGIVDEQAVLERIGITGWQQIMLRINAMKAMQMQIELEAAKNSGKAGAAKGGPPGGK